jgi:hypothetical protein
MRANLDRGILGRRTRQEFIGSMRSENKSKIRFRGRRTRLASAADGG